MQKWEYKAFTLTGLINSDDQNDINDLGKLGWELVSILDKPEINSTLLFFKRPLPLPILND